MVEARSDEKGKKDRKDRYQKIKIQKIGRWRRHKKVDKYPLDKVRYAGDNHPRKGDKIEK